MRPSVRSQAAAARARGVGAARCFAVAALFAASTVVTFAVWSDTVGRGLPALDARPATSDHDQPEPRLRRGAPPTTRHTPPIEPAPSLLNAASRPETDAPRSGGLRRHYDLPRSDRDEQLQRWLETRRRQRELGAAHVDHPVEASTTTAHQAPPTSEALSTTHAAARTLPPVPPLPDMPGRDFVDDSGKHAGDPAALRRYRRGVVIEQIEHSFAGYAKCAWGADEARPISCTAKNWNDMDGWEGPGLGLTIIDSLATLYLANLTKQWHAALDFVKNDLTFDVPLSVSVFETMIRAVGGLIAAYEVSGEQHAFLLDKACDVADRLLPAFDTPMGLPHPYIHLQLGNHSGPAWRGNSVFLAELATNGLELRALTYHTKKLKYAKAANRVNQVVSNICSELGLCHLRYNLDTHQWEGEELSIGGLADSYYEYLLKMYIHSGFEDQPSLARFLRAAATIADELIVFEQDADRAFAASVIPPGAAKATLRMGRPSSSAEEAALNASAAARLRRPTTFRRAFVGVERPGGRALEMDHLTCFAAGMFELGYHAVPWDGPEYTMCAQQQNLPAGLQASFRKVAVGLGRTCHDVGNMTQFALPPEVSSMLDPRDFSRPITGMRVHHLQQPYLLRPEAMESFFYLALFDMRPELSSGPGTSTSPQAAAVATSPWEERAWESFVAIMRHCKVKHGFSGVANVMQRGSEVPDAESVAVASPSSLLPGGWSELDGRAPRHTDTMETFWMAETLKYALLAFSIDEASFFGGGTLADDGIRMHHHRGTRTDPSAGEVAKTASAKIPGLTANALASEVLSGWVLNTEAHPLRIRRDLFDIVPPM